MGKTYSMIEDAHAFKREGVDIVIGFVETHGRAETEARIGELEVVPRRRFDYRGVVLEDMDLDAVLARKPLSASSTSWRTPMLPAAATRSAIRTCSTVGCRHRRDDGGQHSAPRDAERRCESRHGRAVRETVPDAFLDRADEVVNVDVTVEELHSRLRQGKVYKPEKVEQALANFFRETNSRRCASWRCEPWPTKSANERRHDASAKGWSPR